MSVRWGGECASREPKNLGPKAKAPSIFNCITNFRFKIQLEPLYVPLSRVTFLFLFKKT